jgi:hypothetical protein
LQFWDQQNSRYEFPKYKLFSVFKTNFDPGLKQGLTRGAFLLEGTSSHESATTAIGFKED